MDLKFSTSLVDLAAVGQVHYMLPYGTHWQHISRGRMAQQRTTPSAQVMQSSPPLISMVTYGHDVHKGVIRAAAAQARCRHGMLMHCALECGWLRVPMAV